MAPMNIIYISLEGNTRSFLTRMQGYAKQQHSISEDCPLIELKEVSDQTLPADETEPFFAFVPTYLNGGNGIDSGFTEIMTNALGEYIGFVGSGNKNFNEQYCLTARKYARDFDAPFLADYELRGTSQDIERIYTILAKRWSEVNA